MSGLYLDAVPVPLNTQVRVVLGLHLAVEEGRLTLAYVHVADLRRDELVNASSTTLGTGTERDSEVGCLLPTAWVLDA